MAGGCERGSHNLTIVEEKKDPYIDHLENTRAQVREELLVRMKQRDTYSVEMIVILGGLVGLTYAIKDQAYNHIIIPLILIITPAMAIYFTKLIMYSYEVSIALGKYMKEVIEPEFAVKFYDNIQVIHKTEDKVSILDKLSLISQDSPKRYYEEKRKIVGEVSRIEWETYRDTAIYRGVRKQFFLYVMMAVYIFDIIFCIIGVHYSPDKLYYIVAYTIAALYIIPIYLLFDSKEEERFKKINESVENLQTTKLLIRKARLWLLSDFNYARGAIALILVFASLYVVLNIGEFITGVSNGIGILPNYTSDIGISVLFAIIASLSIVFSILLIFIFKK